MRRLNRLAGAPGSPIAAVLSPKPYSTFSGDGGSGSGGGRGRGRGAASPTTPSTQARVPGQPDAAVGDEDSLPSYGHGRGHLPFPSSPGLPPFTSLSASNQPSPSSSAGRGRGRASPAPPAPPSPDLQPKKPSFFRRQDPDSLHEKPIGFRSPDPGFTPEKPQFVDSGESVALPRNLSPVLPGFGRGMPTRTVESGPAPVQENRHLRQPIFRRRPLLPTDGKLGNEEAVRRAVDNLNRAGPGARGRGGRGVFGRGRGRAGRFRSGRGRRDADDELELYLGDNAHGEKFERMLGEERMKIVNEGFEEICSRVLPSPLEEAYLDALHTNNLIEYEPEYIMEFERNPDIDEKPPMPLGEFLLKSKPFLMAFTGLKSQKEWEEAIVDLTLRLPHLKRLVDSYSGPDRVTAKQQQEELERKANTLPTNIPSSVRWFADRAVLSLQSNPGWRFDKKCQFMDKLVRDVSLHYK